MLVASILNVIHSVQLFIVLIYLCSPKVGNYLFLILKLFKFQTRRFVGVTQGLIPCHSLKDFDLFYLFSWGINFENDLLFA